MQIIPLVNKNILWTTKSNSRFFRILNRLLYPLNIYFNNTVNIQRA